MSSNPQEPVSGLTLPLLTHSALEPERSEFESQLWYQLCAPGTLIPFPACLPVCRDADGRWAREGASGCWESGFPVLHCGGWGSIGGRASSPSPAVTSGAVGCLQP